MKVTLTVERKDNPASVYIQDGGSTLTALSHIDKEIEVLKAARAWLKKQLEKKK